MNLIEGVEIVNLDKYEDKRGFLIEGLRSDDGYGVQPQMIYASVTKPGILRGPHEHVSQSDIFLFPGIGTFKLYLWDNRPNSSTFGTKTEIICDVPKMAIVPPGVVHAYKNIGEVDAVSINMPDKLYKGERKQFEVDEIRHENNPDSKFKVE